MSDLRFAVYLAVALAAALLVGYAYGVTHATIPPPPTYQARVVDA